MERRNRLTTSRFVQKSLGDVGRTSGIHISPYGRSELLLGSEVCPVKRFSCCDGWEGSGAQSSSEGLCLRHGGPAGWDGGPAGWFCSLSERCWFKGLSSPCACQEPRQELPVRRRRVPVSLQTVSPGLLPVPPQLGDPSPHLTAYNNQNL